MCGDGHVYNPRTDDVQLDLDTDCLFESREAAEEAVRQSKGLHLVDEAAEGSPDEVDVSHFSSLRFEKSFFWVDENDLGHLCERHQATVFGAAVFVEYPDFDIETQVLTERGNCPVAKYPDYIGQIAEIYPGMEKVEPEPSPVPGP
ncbi:hypothetical protein Salmuc_01726 [Salipiger mucosus DSM 16094]|uniref:Uncharacterized protein n=2 Tax=Salipiger mucosus TaxID=263378 RepID=S9QRC2_9RHOB|nr:hypothetical protein Salmuc_01726 [Salipiger mucosus DSM 16094]